MNERTRAWRKMHNSAADKRLISICVNCGAHIVIELRLLLDLPGKEILVPNLCPPCGEWEWGADNVIITENLGRSLC
jgi:hypothetical protein